MVFKICPLSSKILNKNVVSYYLMILKQVPEDFVVAEIPLLEVLDKGKYCICELSKRNRNTEDAVFEVSRQLRIPRKCISYAGIKDKQAVTSQTISVLTSPDKLKSFNHEDISLRFLGKSDELVSLGRLKGNSFRITIRGLSGDEKISDKSIINFFHEQRFSENNVVIGKYLLKKKYSDAVNLLINDRSWGENIRKHLEKSKNDFVGALKTLPKKILILYVHAYQSYLWNESVKILLNKGVVVDFVPLPGFGGFSASEEVSGVVNDLLQKEGVVSKDFLNRDISFLSVEGTTRKVFIKPSDLVISDFLDDELNIGKKKLVVSFSLGKGEYATNVVEQLFADS
ncbi:tRNA pseudouridine(13) synthase TruD [Candidatus Woesearchaeota archaeon]|nr:tRNA pseudouridine(13) synthase TruD [Candidatus Woesearchaeota archaeon]